MFTVTLTIPDLDTESPKTACTMFLAALMSADWHTTGMVFSLLDHETGKPVHVRLTGEDVARALTTNN